MTLSSRSGCVITQRLMVLAPVMARKTQLGDGLRCEFCRVGYLPTGGDAVSRMGGASKERERASYGDHLVKIGLPPLSSATVNLAAASTVDRHASLAHGASRTRHPHAHP